MKSALVIFGSFAAFAAPIAIDASAHSVTYRNDWTLSGYRAVVEVKRGRLGLAHDEKIVGYFLAGSPRFVAFGCDGHAAPVITVERAALPRCARVEPIEQEL